MLVTRKSALSGVEHTIDLPITPDQLSLFHARGTMLLQEVFPELSPDEREFVKTGITPEEWDTAFKGAA